MQTITSAKTSLNQIPALHKKIDFQSGTTNLDYGGGAYEKTSEWLYDTYNVRNVVYDPFNRYDGYTVRVVNSCFINPTDSCTCANVLNVIDCSYSRRGVLRGIAAMTKINAPVYFWVHEGDRTGKGNLTKNGECWQENRKTEDYLEEIRAVFPNATRKGRVISATNSGGIL